MGRFEGKVGLVTGGASGIGHAVALRLASEGAQVVIADIDEEGGARVASENERITFLRTDVSQGDQVESTVAATVERFGKLDVVHANAGIETPPLLLADTPDEWFDRAISVNAKGIFLTCKHSINHFMERGEGGAIVCTSSILDPGVVREDRRLLDLEGARSARSSARSRSSTPRTASARTRSCPARRRRRWWSARSPTRRIPTRSGR